MKRDMAFGQGLALTALHFRITLCICVQRKESYIGVGRGNRQWPAKANSKLEINWCGNCFLSGDMVR